jgi:hypothetical protein
MSEGIKSDIDEIISYEIKEINPSDIDILIEILLYHNNRPIQDLLRSKNLKCSGSTKDLKEKLKKYYNDGEVSSSELITLLDQLENYGNQHIYLFKLSNPILKYLRNFELVYKTLEDEGFSKFYNYYDPLILPETPEIISIKHDSDSFKIRWGVKKENLGDLVEERYTTDNDDGRKYLTKKYLIEEVRETTLFQVDLTNGEAELLIKRSKGADYDEEKDKYLNQIYDIFGWDPLEAIKLNNTINKIGNSDEVIARTIALKTPKESIINIGSPSKNEGISDDPEALKAKDSLNRSVGTRGYFYWLTGSSSGTLKRDLYTRIYQDRFSVYGERTEEEITYVIERIRHHL